MLEDRGRPSDLDICTVTQYLSIFAKHFIGFRKHEKYGKKIFRKVKLKVFCSNPRSSGLPIEILCFMTGFLRLPFVRRPWKTIRLAFLYSKSISKHFRKLLSLLEKTRKIWVKNISQSEIKSFFAQIQDLPGLPLKSFVS